MVSRCTISSNSQSCAFEGTTLPKPLSGLWISRQRRLPISEVTSILKSLFFLVIKVIIVSKAMLFSSKMIVHACLSRARVHRRLRKNHEPSTMNYDPICYFCAMNFLTEAVVKAAKSLYEADLAPAEVTLQETRKEFEGQVTVVIFPFTKFSRKSPEQTGNEIGEFLKNEVSEISGFNVIKGFLNISLSDAYWLDRFYSEISTDDFAVFKPNGKKVMVEFSSPNTNKPLLLGHVRNNLLGFSVAEIFTAAGYEVIKANLVNDRGIHICKSMLAWQRFGNGETPESSGMKGDHLVGKYYVLFDKEYKKQVDELKAQGQTEEEAKKNAPFIKEAQEMLLKWEAGNKEVISLWQTMNSWVYAGFNETYKRLGVDFDKFYYESNTYLLGN